MRAITLCWTENSDISARLMMNEVPAGDVALVSMVFGTTRFDTKPMAYRIVTKNVR